MERSLASWWDRGRVAGSISLSSVISNALLKGLETGEEDSEKNTSNRENGKRVEIKILKSRNNECKCKKALCGPVKLMKRTKVLEIWAQICNIPGKMKRHSYSRNYGPPVNFTVLYKYGLTKCTLVL